MNGSCMDIYVCKCIENELEGYIHTRSVGSWWKNGAVRKILHFTVYICVLSDLLQ